MGVFAERIERDKLARKLDCLAGICRFEPFGDATECALRKLKRSRSLSSEPGFERCRGDVNVLQQLAPIKHVRGFEVGYVARLGQALEFGKIGVDSGKPHRVSLVRQIEAKRA